MVIPCLFACAKMEKGISKSEAFGETENEASFSGTSPLRFRCRGGSWFGRRSIQSLPSCFATQAPFAHLHSLQGWGWNCYSITPPLISFAGVAETRDSQQIKNINNWRNVAEAAKCAGFRSLWFSTYKSSNLFPCI